MNKILGITSDSRDVKPGYMFVALKGLRTDGYKYIPEALKKGAKVIVSEKFFKVPTGIDFVKVEDARVALGKYVSEFYNHPSDKLKLIGVTGTKGKTTTVHLIYHLLTKLGKKAGMVSSIVAKIGETEKDTGFHVTNPDIVALNKYLDEMVKKGCEYAVLEVSSHGIDQGRIAGLNFEVGVLTNIVPEHLDYHKTFREYKRVKMSFINSCKHQVVAPISTALSVLPGEFNNLNAEAAIKVLEVLGFSIKETLNGLKSFKLPLGRLEEIPNDSGIRIVIDFAHTAESLEAALKHLSKTKKGKLISVFGCAGERDKGKRFKMAKVSVKHADMTILTAEDPRSERILDILKVMTRGAIAGGGKLNGNFVSIPERGEAIPYALSIAQRGDTIGIFGKGHEKSMAYKGYEHKWSDHEAVKNFLDRDKNTSAIILAAGKGSRMHSELPKVLHEICGRPMISYSLGNLRNARIGEIVTVLSFKKELIKKVINGTVKIAIQKNPKGGTGQATEVGLKEVSRTARDVMVLYGDDTAFYTPKTITSVLSTHKKNSNILTFVTLIKDDPHGLGRIIRDDEGNVVEIVEEKDATDSQRKIKEVNDGLYIFNKRWLDENVNKIAKSEVTGEFYITDLIRLALKTGQVNAYKLPDESEWQGINTPEQLAEANEKMVKNLS